MTDANAVRRFHRWLDDHESLKFAAAVLVGPLLIVTMFHGATAPRVVAAALFVPYILTRAWCVCVPEARP